MGRRNGTPHNGPELMEFVERLERAAHELRATVTLMGLKNIEIVHVFGSKTAYKAIGELEDFAGFAKEDLTLKLNPKSQEVLNGHAKKPEKTKAKRGAG